MKFPLEYVSVRYNLIKKVFITEQLDNIKKKKIIR